MFYQILSEQHGEGQARALRGREGRFSTKKPACYCSAGACPPRTYGEFSASDEFITNDFE